jgi:hypothetical protein
VCVGAALLVPAGGLAMFGVGTAGATTSFNTVSPSTAKLGTLGTITVVGISCSGTGTFQCTGTHQAAINRTGVKQGTALIPLTKWLVNITPGPPKTVKGIVIKASQVAIKSTVKPGINGCTILLPKITLIKGTPATLWFAHTISTTTVLVKGTCTTKSLIQTEISGSKINVNIQVSVI